MMDLLLDPVGTGSQAWRWEADGGYYTTPLGNFVGWFLVGMAIFGGYFLCERSYPARPIIPDGQRFARLGASIGCGMFVLPAALAITLGRPVAVVLFVMGMAPVLASFYSRRN
jgi:uncharacterized membrane protein